MERILTIFTPTYNRKEYLPNLYKSLQNQTDSDFEWLIVDDGSTDGTKQLIDEWILENKVRITYIYQENQGKPAAHNTAVLNAKSELICICDSDDVMERDAVRRIKDVWFKIKTKKNMGGMIAYMKMENPPNGDFSLPNEGVTRKVFEFMRNGVFDTVQIYRTEVLRENLFPRFPNEKFVPEMAIWTQIDMYYDTYVLSEVLEKGKYLDNGLSRGSYDLFKNNRMGYAFLFYNHYRYEKKKKHYKKAIVHLGKCCALSRKACNMKLIDCISVWDRILAFPITVLAMIKYR